MIILSVKKIKRIILFLLVLLLFYTRLVNLSWGLPYPFHPDERNMANALQQLHCEISNLKECLNPHFFAYGQFPLYLGYGMVRVYKFFRGELLKSISFEEATLALRLISSFASVLLVYFVVKVVQMLNKIQKDSLSFFASLLIFIFSPALIQFAHFGTTESLLMLFYIWLVYESLSLMNKKITLGSFLLTTSVISGLAIATKVSSLIFMAIPVLMVFYYHKNKLYKIFKSLVLYFSLSLVVGFIFSPHNLISFNEFLGAFHYESAVALGTLPVFYTRQFAGTIPIIFQFLKIFPYALGWPVLIFFIAGFFALPLNKQNNLLRFSFLAYFLPNAFLYAKWTRFMSPVMPIMIVIAVLLLLRAFKNVNNFRKVVGAILALSFIIPGVAYLSVYAHPDIRFTASDWINRNIQRDSIILSETGNVVDIPLTNTNNYQIFSFNFYDLDENKQLQLDLSQNLEKASYIFIPSRRIFMNHSKEKYPLLREYYSKLSSDSLGFKKIAEFAAYPKISFLGQTLLKFPDENAEETWSVFDHPVIRIYKR